MATFTEDRRELTSSAIRSRSVPPRTWFWPLILIGVMAAFATVEWFSSPVEVALGELMVWSSDIRPETGRGWEFSHEGAEAAQELGRLTSDVRQRETAASQLRDLSEVRTQLDSIQVFSISPKRFLELITRVPEALRNQLINPVELLRVRTSEDWHRVFFVGEAGADYIYLVDPNNLVLYQTRIDDAFYEKYDQVSRSLAARIEDVGGFAHIVRAEEFFELLKPGGQLVIGSLDMGWITSLDGKLLRVGVAGEPQDGLWKLGFEVNNGGYFLLHSYYIEEWQGRQLVSEIGRRKDRERDLSRRLEPRGGGL